MKIAEYNEMMAYLMRPEPKMQVADLVDDLEPGSLKDELLKDFDPSQETYEEYLQRKSLDRTNLAIGGGVVEGENLGTREGFGTPTKGVMSIGEYAGQPFARHRGDELPRGSIRISPDRIVFTGEDAQKNIDRFFNNRLFK